MFTIMLIIVIVSSAWMAGDSAKLKLSIDGKPYGTNNGQWAWFLSGLLLWIATFPYYLYKRSQVNTSPPMPVAPATRSLAAELSELEAAKRAGTITEADYERAKAKLLK